MIKKKNKDNLALISYFNNNKEKNIMGGYNGFHYKYSAAGEGRK